VLDKSELVRKRYQLKKLIAVTHSSEIWLAWDPTENQYVTLKYIRSLEHANQEIMAYKHFKRRGPHPGRKYIPRLLAYFNIEQVDASVTVLVLETLGIDTKRLMILHGTVPFYMIRQIAFQVLTTLDYLHNSLRMVHLDIKPRNIMLEVDQSDIPRLFDLAEEDRQCVAPSSERKNRRPPFINAKLIDFNGAILRGVKPPHFVTTEGYAAPEVRKRLSEKADVFSLGVTLFEYATGEKYLSFFPQGNRKHFLTQEEIVLEVNEDMKSYLYDNYGKKGNCFLKYQVEPFWELISRMVDYDKDNRPTVKELLESEYLRNFDEENREEMLSRLTYYKRKRNPGVKWWEDLVATETRTEEDERWLHTEPAEKLTCGLSMFFGKIKRKSWFS